MAEYKCRTKECKKFQNCVNGNGTEFKPDWSEKGLTTENDMDLFFKFEVCNSCEVEVRENALLKKPRQSLHRKSQDEKPEETEDQQIEPEHQSQQ